MSTIVALSSGTLPSGVAVLRVSGSQAAQILISICGDMIPARQARLRVFRGADSEAIDRGLALWFPAPASFTGEDCLELHCHGGRAVVDRLLQTITAFDGVRLAEPGEFARRAFAHGKLDLTEAEGIGDLVAADTEAQRQLAVEQAGGGQRMLYDDWRSRLLHARAMIEAEIDFTDEDDVPGSVSERIWSDMAQLRTQIEAHLQREERGRLVREGFRIALLGAPNAGKSTLMNCLAGSERAIVSPQPGTTRDVIDARLDLDGHLVIVSDTAGVRETDDSIEREGVMRALRAGTEADLVLHLDEGGAFETLELPEEAEIWRVRSKIDVPIDPSSYETGGDFAISALTGEGVEDLIAALTGHVNDRVGHMAGVAPSRARHSAHLRRSHHALGLAQDDNLALEIRAEHLRVAGDEIGRLTGVIDVEDVLGAIFSRFCIGK